MIRLVLFLAGLLMASPALAAPPLYCQAAVAVADGSLVATVFPPGPHRGPLFRWTHGDRATGEVSLSYLGDPADLRLDRVSVVVDKSANRAAAKALHRAQEGELMIGLGEEQWRSNWHDWRRWDDPAWILAIEYRFIDAPAWADLPLRLTFLQRPRRPVHAVALTTPAGPELAEAATRALAQATEALRTEKGCVDEPLDLSSVI